MQALKQNNTYLTKLYRVHNNLVITQQHLCNVSDTLKHVIYCINYSKLHAVGLQLMFIFIDYY